MSKTKIPVPIRVDLITEIIATTALGMFCRKIQVDVVLSNAPRCVS